MAATITINNSPTELQPVPVENCIEFCASFDGVIENVGTQAMVTVEFVNNEPQMVGQTFVFAGVEFEVNNTINPGNYGGRFVDLTSTSGGLNAALLLAAIVNHPKFQGKVTGVVVTIDAITSALTITWNKIGEQQDFYFVFSNLDYPLNYTSVNGTSHDYIDGYRMGYKVVCLDSSPVRDIIPLQQVPMIFDKDGQV